MKFIFIALVIGNLAFVAWQFWGHDDIGTAPDHTAAEDAPNTLQTLVERDATTKKIKRNQSKVPRRSVSFSSGSGDPKQCQLIGPFAELLHAEYIVEQLAVADVLAQIKHVEIMDGKNYWVYLKPEISEKEALRRLYEIQAKSIDGYIIPSGELANGISFGQFSDEKEATQKMILVKDQGYLVEIKEIPKSHSEVWVEINGKDEQKISEELWLAVLKQEKNVERRQNYCLGVAN